jgi:hypothetical protein
MLKSAFVLTTALVLGCSTSIAGTETGSGADANARFLSWYAGALTPGAGHHLRPHDDSKLLYDQSASSGYSSNAVSATNLYSSSGYCCWGNIAADDFVIPGTGTHKITSVYAAGVNRSGTPQWMTVTFYDRLKYYATSGITSVVTKATCDSTSFTDSNGDVLVDLSSCKLGRFKGGHDYAVAVQANSYYGGRWAWQTNRNQIGRQAFYFTYGESGTCTMQYTPIKTCFPATGYGPDLAFAIYGR